MNLGILADLPAPSTQNAGLNYGLMADLMVIVHALFVAFVVFGELAILVGVVCRWAWARHFWFRLIHLVCILVVAVEGVFAWECPLTTWEYDLRVMAGQEVTDATFMGRLAHNFLFYDAPQKYFDIGHIVFGILVLVTFIVAPPRWRKKPAENPAEPAPDSEMSVAPAESG